MIYSEITSTKNTQTMQKADYLLKKQFYSSYRTRLADTLHDYDIEVLEESTEGISECGEPCNEVMEYEWMNVGCLRNERALCTVYCRGCTFGFPDNGIGLRYLYLSSNSEDREWARKIDKNCESLLALCSDGKELYCLTGKGKIKSTAPNWKTIKLFDPIDERRKICANIPCDQIYKALDMEIKQSGLSKWGIISILDGFTFYDAINKVFLGRF